ncbi:MAG: hypothetical protein U0703_08400 [Anaerolineae bacterium]
MYVPLGSAAPLVLRIRARVPSSLQTMTALALMSVYAPLRRSR